MCYATNMLSYQFELAEVWKVLRLSLFHLQRLDRFFLEYSCKINYYTLIVALPSSLVNPILTVIGIFQYKEFTPIVFAQFIFESMDMCLPFQEFQFYSQFLFHSIHSLCKCQTSISVVSYNSIYNKTVAILPCNYCLFCSLSKYTIWH